MKSFQGLESRIVPAVLLALLAAGPLARASAAAGTLAVLGSPPAQLAFVYGLPLPPADKPVRPPLPPRLCPNIRRVSISSSPRSRLIEITYFSESSLTVVPKRLVWFSPQVGAKPRER